MATIQWGGRSTFRGIFVFAIGGEVVELVEIGRSGPLGILGTLFSRGNDYGNSRFLR